MAGSAYSSDNSAMWNVFYPAVEGTPAKQAVKQFKSSQDFAGAWIALLELYNNLTAQGEIAARANFIVNQSNLPDKPSQMNLEQYLDALDKRHL